MKVSSIDVHIHIRFHDLDDQKTEMENEGQASQLEYQSDLDIDTDITPQQTVHYRYLIPFLLSNKQYKGTYRKSTNLK